MKTSFWRFMKHSTNWPAEDSKKAELAKLRYFVGLTLRSG